jgi:putative tryptophan/tyrosine transport system substrate-binding protein
MFDRKRREFITLLGSAAAARPLAARAQQPVMPVIGFLGSRSPADSAYLVAAFRKGLGEASYVEGQNVTIEFRWARGQYDQLPALAADLVSHQVAVIVAVGGEPSALAAKAASSTIPLVFTTGGDPVKIGLVASLNRPGGNTTGVSLLTTAPEAKRLGLLHELVPSAALIGVLINPNYQEAEAQSRELQEGARSIGQQLHIVNAKNEGELDSAFATLVQKRADALLVSADPFFDTKRDRIIAFAAQYRLPAIYQFRDYALAGVLMSYGISITDGYRQVGIYTGQILKGAKPADLPVVQSIKFEFVLNLKTAKVLGLEVPPTLSARADEVIE